MPANLLSAVHTVSVRVVGCTLETRTILRFWSKLSPVPKKNRSLMTTLFCRTICFFKISANSRQRNISRDIVAKNHPSQCPILIKSYRQLMFPGCLANSVKWSMKWLHEHVFSLCYIFCWNSSFRRFHFWQKRQVIKVSGVCSVRCHIAVIA